MSLVPMGTRSSGNSGTACGKPSLTSASSEFLDLLPHCECPGTSYLATLILGSLKVSLTHPPPKHMDNRLCPSAQPRAKTHGRVQ